MLPSANLNTNFINAIPPGVIKDNAAFVSNVIDLADDAVRGAQFLCFVVTLGATDVDLATFKVMQSDTETDSTTLGGTPTEIVDITDTVTPGPTDDNKVYLVTIDLRQELERYIQLQVTAGNGTAGTYLSAICLPVCPAEIATNNNAAAHVTA